MILVEHSADRPPAFDAGVLLGLLIAEGSFGGDGRQPHVILRKHTRHEPLFRWLKARFPHARLYGPYHHSGRSYYQFVWRGAQLRYGLMPLLEAFSWSALDPHAYARYAAMKERYGLPDVPPEMRRLTGDRPSTAAAFPEFLPGAESATGSARSSARE